MRRGLPGWQERQWAWSSVKVSSAGNCSMEESVDDAMEWEAVGIGLLCIKIY